MYRIIVAVLFGGCSEEHTVSIKSAMVLAAKIDTEKYQPFYIGITKSGVWKLCEKPCLDWEQYAKYPVIFSPGRNTHGFLIQKKDRYETQSVDVVFPIIHGKFGEDGSIQGLLELSGIPYVGCDIQSSVICMDKSLAYTTVKNAGIEVPDFQIIQDGDNPKTECFIFPLFVKPARSGSSFGHGFFKIHQEAQPEKGSENATIQVPADLPAKVREQIQETAKKIYQTLGCRGLARIDLFLREDGQIVLNEVNTMPGFTSYSRYPRMMTAAGFPLSELIDRLIELALRR